MLKNKETTICFYRNNNGENPNSILKIEDVIGNFYYYKLTNRDENQKKVFEEIKTNLRKQIASRLKSQEQFKRITKNLTPYKKRMG